MSYFEDNFDYIVFGKGYYPSYNKKRKREYMSNFDTVFVSGKLYWAKVFKAVDNYERTGKEWTVDFVPDDTSFLKEHRLLDRLKESDFGDYIRLRKPEKDKEGEKNEPIRIYNADDEKWDSDVAIGNGSSADVKLTIADFGKGKKKAIWVKAIRVTDHVPYASNEFAGMASTNVAKPDKTKVKAKAQADVAKDFADDDDEMPF